MNTEEVKDITASLCTEDSPIPIHQWRGDRFKADQIHKGFSFTVPAVQGDLQDVLAKCKGIYRGRYPKPYLAYYRDRDMFMLNVILANGEINIAITPIGYREDRNFEMVEAEIKARILYCFTGEVPSVPTYTFDRYQAFIVNSREEAISVQVNDSDLLVSEGNATPIYALRDIGYPSVILCNQEWSQTEEAFYSNYTHMSVDEAKKFIKEIREGIAGLETSLDSL